MSDRLMQSLVSKDSPSESVARSLSTIVGVPFTVIVDRIESGVDLSLDQKARLSEICEKYELPIHEGEQSYINAKDITSYMAIMLASASENENKRIRNLNNGKEILSKIAGINVDFNEEGKALVMHAGEYSLDDFAQLHNLGIEKTLKYDGRYEETITIKDIDINKLCKKFEPIVQSSGSFCARVIANAIGNCNNGR